VRGKGRGERGQKREGIKAIRKGQRDKRRTQGGREEGQPLHPYRFPKVAQKKSNSMRG
jgi:hypothetical protein